MHARVTKAQLNVQKELLKCVQCTHGNLPPQCESMVFEFLSTLYEAYLNQSTANEYQLFKSINPTQSNTCSFVFRCSQTIAVRKFRLFEFQVDLQASHSRSWNELFIIFGPDGHRELQGKLAVCTAT